MKRREKADGRVVKALRRAGVHVESVYDLVNDPSSHPKAVEPLLVMLSKIEESTIKEGIVRALADKAAKGVAAEPMIRELREGLIGIPDLLYLWAVGNTLITIADDSVFDDLLELVQDRRLGMARETLALALGKFRRQPAAKEVLMNLLDDPEIEGHAIGALRNLNATEAYEGIQPFLNHEKAWIRREAKKALKKFDELREREAARG